MKEQEKILEEIDETIDRYGSNPELITESLVNFMETNRMASFCVQTAERIYGT